ncbi:MAG: methionine--tRNA ligase [Candidatus Improbicoccus pseudotrichonymphae]|uniref:Methionine--tRNA ligase n=1 Tax=Candidatus Improbicoccus pseudotrichonymphae TaxID=3033792 RepID=A0AA48I4B2_9FIRM|nr:MAG: methionine--tRNA ligase [Candidatus Improbicoccus pseudotrichonymphae]
MKNFFITTPIYYPSGQAHLGHCYSTIASDVMARYKKMKGFEVFFSTGTDEHGQKIEANAKSKGLKPIEYIEPIVDNFKKLWKVLGISYDIFIRTTDENHKLTVQKVFESLYKKNKIYKGRYEGWYCLPCESFFSESNLKDGKCPDCGREVKKQSEEAYFFRLSDYGGKLLEFYEENPDFVQPETRKNEMINFINSGLEDLCVSRTNFEWGIQVPFDSKHVIYVWFDALINYISVLGYGSNNGFLFEKFWPADFHIVGKEITRFHTVVWPAVLMALDLPISKCVYGHGWLLFNNDKMSKSKGNIIDPFVLCDKYGADPIRYFLMREIPFGLDGSFDETILVNRLNSDLANDLGNLISRMTSFAHGFFQIVEDFESSYVTLSELGANVKIDLELIEKVDKLIEIYEENMDKLKFALVLSKIWEVISFCNKYVDLNSPWKFEKDKKGALEVSKVLYNVFETLRIIAILLSPFIPKMSEEIMEIIGSGKNDFLNDLKWGVLDKKSKIKKCNSFFRRIIPTQDNNDDKNLNLKEESCKNSEIKIEDFSKLDLRVAKVLECQKIKKTDNLFKCVLFDGKKMRTIVSGTAKYYIPEDLVNRNVIIITNLSPITLCGIRSEGMILTSEHKDTIAIVFVDNLKPGSKIS